MGCCHGCLSMGTPRPRPAPVFDQRNTYRPATVAAQSPDSARLHRVRPRQRWSYAACLCMVPEAPSAGGQATDASSLQVHVMQRASAH